MMVWTKSGDRQALQAQERERQHFERQIRGFLEEREVTLALARMTREEDFSFDPDMRGAPASETMRRRRREGPKFLGVVHERSSRASWEKLEKWIQVTMLVDGKPKSPHLGTATLSTSAGPKDALRLNRQLRLEVVIGDEDNAIFDSLTLALRDRAISGDSFMHVGVRFDSTDVDTALTELQHGKGYWMVPVHGIYFKQDVTLSKAPGWGWRWSLD